MLVVVINLGKYICKTANNKFNDGKTDAVIIGHVRGISTTPNSEGSK